LTFKDLQKVIESQEQAGQGLNQNQLQKLRNKEFWYWFERRHKDVDRLTKGDCCFNHIISLPKKNGKEMPLFEYERLLYRALMEPDYLNSHPGSKGEGGSKTHPKPEASYSFKEKHLFIKKATGIGCTEFMLRFMAWLCLKDDACKNSQVVIVTWPNIDLAIKLIKRMKGLFLEKLGVTFDSKETVLELNGCNIQAFPSNHIDSFRSLTNPKFLLIDEGDYMPKFQQDEVRAVSERYIAKSDPFIVMVSTPNAPGGLFQRIEQEPFETCIYKKIFLDYTYGLGSIYY
jgi:hypothetical protein